jgi:hypothetical protein
VESGFRNLFWPSAVTCEFVVEYGAVGTVRMFEEYAVMDIRLSDLQAKGFVRLCEVEYRHWLLCAFTA